jgi:acyl-CoA oxidase
VQGTREQQDDWVPRGMGLSIFGCFAMTELRGGSFVRGLETVARFIPGAGPDGDGEFDIHTPSISATKWWIGGAGETATHAAVYARLVVGGVDVGVHTFIVQLRDTDTHGVAPGVRIGDLGAKLGRNGIDNGAA